jgi:hypothetical protein
LEDEKVSDGHHLECPRHTYSRPHVLRRRDLGRKLGTGGSTGIFWYTFDIQLDIEAGQQKSCPLLIVTEVEEEVKDVH